jgi:enamine deaminase RidA (YjgF/YER057c/UK114 family)
VAGGAGPPSRRLADLGLVLPPVAAPAGAYVPAVRDGDLVWTAGQLPFTGGKLAATGLVGAQVDAVQAAELARLCALNALAAAASVAGGLDGLGRIVKVVGFVASAAGFTAQPAVVNGASELLGAIFGEAGRHARSAVGVAALPLDAPVELELVARLAG